MNRSLQPVIYVLSWDFTGAPGRIRTRDPLLRRQLLCPAELRALERNCARRRSRDGYMKVAVCRPLTPCHLGKRQAASPPRTPNRRDYLTPPSAVETLRADQPNQRDARGPIGQLRVKGGPAVTRQSRPLRVAPFTASSSRAGVAAQGDKRIDAHVPLGFAEKQTDRNLTQHRADTSAPEDSTQSRQTAPRALRLAVCPRKCRAAAKSRYSRPG
jgi:hypothetical protein